MESECTLGSSTTEQFTRCVNLDWLEVHCLEPYGSPRDAEYFRAAGYVVHERSYGTRVYREMFVLDGTDGEPLLEVRRNPASQGALGIHLAEECHIRLCNRTCYFNDAAEQLQRFLSLHGYEFNRVSRADICLDFDKFDYGDNPQDFLTRYIKHRYAKINQCNRTTHGEDRWSGCVDNSVSWGSPHSDIGTKMYNKTLELRNTRDGSFKKPYILWAWHECGLIDDPIRCTVTHNGDTQLAEIWRIEFSIRSSVKNWFVIELNGEQKHYQSIRNTLDMYAGRDRLLTLFASLSQHYFRFKHYRTDRRKDRCDDKLLFNWEGLQRVYKVGKEAHAIGNGSKQNQPLLSLIDRLRYYQSTHVARDIHKACDVLIEAMESETVRAQMRYNWTREELEALQLALNGKLQGDPRDISVMFNELKQLLRINDNTAPF